MTDTAGPLKDAFGQNAKDANRIEKDRDSNLAADKIVGMVMEADTYQQTIDWGVHETLLKEAGRALANRYGFAVAETEEGMTVFCTAPQEYLRKHGRCDDKADPLAFCLPETCAALGNALWQFPAGVSAVDAAKTLHEYGFEWSQMLQNGIDPEQTQKVADALGVAVERQKALETPQIKEYKISEEQDKEYKTQIPAMLANTIGGKPADWVQEESHAEAQGNFLLYKNKKTGEKYLLIHPEGSDTMHLQQVGGASEEPDTSAKKRSARKKPGAKSAP